jgi:hypothetical protein
MPNLEENSRRTRVMPTFTWLKAEAGTDWPTRFVEMADGLAARIEPGRLIPDGIHFEPERRIPPLPRRLAWLIRNVERLTPRDGRNWRQYDRRVTKNSGRTAALAKLDADDSHGIDRRFLLEGKTSADCLIECERAVIWVEGKRNDWLDYSIKWDVTRDQLARNLEAAWLFATERAKDCCLVICHEHPMKYHEELLIQGYRHGTWSGGWPHLNVDERRLLGSRIGTVTWSRLAAEWPGLKKQFR